MDYTLSVEELAMLRQAHGKMKEKRFADRFKAVYLLGSGWTAKKVSEALLVDEDTVRNWFHLYQRSNTGRQRLNSNGVFSFKRLRPLIRTEETINAQAAIRLLDDLAAAQPEGKVTGVNKSAASAKI